MLKNHKTKSALKIVSVFLLMINFVFAHEDERESTSLRYTFKQRIHDLCSGHGLMHLKPLERQKIANLFSKNLKDITSLQQGAKSDNYLCQLTALIIRSDLPKLEKQNLLNKSYEISLAQLKKGNEWPFTVTILIEETNILSVEEITKYTQSANEYLRYISKKSVKELKYDKPKNELDKPMNDKIPSEKPSSINTKRAKLSEDYKTIPHQVVSPDKDNSLPIDSEIIGQGGSRINDNSPKNYILYIIVGVLFIGAIFVFLRSCKKNQN